ncbi:16S rRNA (uracil(1498)-N(3))-methyltransferase [Luteimonas saliphila]|uniref:16S rRNA (uracil(1498)-N(3))-methyltransferase n=1 Tax=Luteimonas saliphila TaxID=2804919 RepID=UPI00192D889F|nr:16S rRNA (uracil(1498)-N(3))-methyltransferase [Luteimonas saliphila]
MRVIRTYVDVALAVGARITLPAEAAAHLVRVLRLREGDECVLFNGDGHDYAARITASGKRDTLVEIHGAQAVDNESPLRVTLLQGIARGEKMDLILQKATELGVARIVPVDADRTEVRLDGARMTKRVAHWRGIVSSACAQCGRARLPQVCDPLDIASAAIQAGDTPCRLVLDPMGALGLSTLAAAAAGEAAGPVVIAIGPEGGWSPRDRQRLYAAGFEGLRLGPRVLRTETAGLAAIAALQALYGDLRG